MRSLVILGTLIFVLGLSSVGMAETFEANLQGAQEVPAVNSTATGYARVFIDEATGTLRFTVVFSGLSSNQTASHIHAPGAIGVSTAVAINFGAVGGTSGTISGTTTVTPTQLAQIRAHLGYVNVHSTNFPGGEIRGQLGIKRPVDFDGDGREDLSILRFPTVNPPALAQATYWNSNSTSGVFVANFGDANTDFPIPGDYDGDGKDDLALYRTAGGAGANTVIFIFRSSDNTVQAFNFGLTGDRPVCRDYDGDGITDVAIFRPGATAGTQAQWWIRRSTTLSNLVIGFGTTGDGVNTGDEPIPGDYDGDGKFDLAVYRRGGLVPNNSFIIRRSSDSVVTYQQFGDFNTDFVLPGDYDGDGKYDLAIARTGTLSTSPLVWWILQSSNGQVRVQTFGRSSDTPVQGDYDGDARADIAVYRRGATASAASTFWVWNSFTNAASATNWGLGNDFAVNSFDAR